ncbi:hypothetical protein T459_11797 [Capsicum annuum]|uniref:Uncharacterized protein n=1 Tax=Capsicum annuum TaxID=4072 RepID=A0A2G2ZN65_CAPAN|nr:hypothetical protein T459_11797 [Capsicum annuum]
MGYATSKEKVCQNYHAPYSPVRKSYSMYIPKRKDINDNDQPLVNLTYSTLGSLKLDSVSLNQSLRNNHFAFEIDDYNAEKDELLIEAKMWPQMINEKIPKVVIPVTPVRTPRGEPETINAWELMEGLEDFTPLKHTSHHHDYSFSFPVSPNTISSRDDRPNENSKDSLKMAYNESSFHSNDTSIVSDFDPELISTFIKALEELPPANPFYLKPLVIKNMQGKDDEAEAVSSSMRQNKEALTKLLDGTAGPLVDAKIALVRTRSNSGQNMSATELKEVLGKWKKTRIVQFMMKQKPEFGSIRSRLFSREVTPAMDIVLEVVFYEETRLGTQAILESMSLPTI